MRANDFWSHWNITENPFHAEEARDDSVFMRLNGTEATHPDFAKIFGAPSRPTAAVVFGEKGSGKTALRLTMENRYAGHNGDTSSHRVWVVRYDNFNPMLDTLCGPRGKKDPLTELTLEDHQDAILSQAVTRLVDAISGDDDRVPGFEQVNRSLRRMPRYKRVNLGLLAALYDQPKQGRADERFETLKRRLRLQLPVRRWAVIGALMTILAVLIALVGEQSWLPDWQRYALMLATALGGGLILFRACALGLSAYTTAGRVRRTLRTIRRSVGELAERLQFKGRPAASDANMPVPGSHDSRYQLTARLLDVLNEFGYSGMVVLVDCVDEPAAINGDPQKMKSFVWPMMNNKFLQQEHIGIKMLLPIELHYIVHRESEAFFKEARLDKQNMIDRLAWSGSALYDLANLRLAACREEGGDPLVLRDLFMDDVTAVDLADALDQMQQPRDAFKFLYQVVHEHCAATTAESSQWKIPRLTLTQVAKAQALRLSEMQRGLQPA